MLVQREHKTRLTNTRHPWEEIAEDSQGNSPASAIENAIAALKNSVRGRPDSASGLLARGYERIGLALPPDGSLVVLITSLADSCARQEPHLATMASEIRQLTEVLLTPPPGTGG